ncbi:MAG TPA: AMP-binding protein [Caulobacteraceae bacterium]
MEKLFAKLDRFGDAIAVIDEQGSAVTYANLLALAEAQIAPLGAGRKLVAIEIANRLPPLAAYIGAIRAGHAVILTGPDGASSDAAIVRKFKPDAVFRHKDEAWRLTPGADRAAALHEDLAVLLSTSGSTGSAKLVRLSHANLAANARSIIDYLELRPDDAAITTLPAAYSYGLSVIHSHLLAGARLVLFEGSVSDPDFAERLDRHGATGFAGVPHTYDLLERTGFDQAEHPSLRHLTQAGGRLAPDQVSAWAASARACGQRFYVMYGQTEAAPRMAYMPPQDLERYPGCIGRAVPGGDFRLELLGGDGDEGELIYTGPNVMMGYAESREDLARGAELAELRTGDIARRNAAGYYQITGRISRFSKVFGLRIGLDQVEARLAEAGYAAAVAADDSGLVVAAPPGCADAVMTVLEGPLGLPRAAFKILPVEALPRFGTGKIDYPTILKQGRAAEARPVASTNLRQALGQVLGVKAVRPEDTFISLGGDSLNYVRAWLVLEDRLGRCPDGWETMTMAELEGDAPIGPRRRMAIDSDVLARAVAIALVVLHHVTSSAVGGGATSLLLVAGMNFSRFQTPKLVRGRLWPVLQPVMAKVLIPYFTIVTAFFLLQRSFFAPQYLLVSNFTQGAAQAGARTTIFWYVETYFWLILASSLLVMLPGARRLLLRRPWTFSLSLLLATTLLGLAAKLVPDLPVFYTHTPFTMAYVFAYGWAIPLAKSPPRKALLAIVGAVTLFLLEPAGVEFAAPVTLATLLLLLFVRKITLGWKLTQLVSVLAGASLYIYLTHSLVLHPLRSLLGGGIPLALTLPVTLFCFAVGIGLWWLINLVETGVGRTWERFKPAVEAAAKLPVGAS